MIPNASIVAFENENHSLPLAPVRWTTPVTQIEGVAGRGEYFVGGVGIHLPGSYGQR
jgi:hypothetical protein